MLLLAIDSILLLFISAGTGSCMLTCLQRMFRQTIPANVLGVILAGLIFSTIYFNLVSFWLPVNYATLMPLFAVSTYVFGSRNNIALSFISSAKKQCRYLFLKPNIYATIPVCIMLLYYWLLPPVNADSPGYHYSTILWFESYKVVPGLANVDGRLAYNSAAFIIQAAYAFTRLTGQSLYPLNGVLTIFFFLWMMGKILRSTDTFTGFAWFILLYLLNRVLLVNMSSPTADTLVIICLAYAIIRIFEALIANKPSPYFLLPLVILLYAVIAKLSAYSIVLLVPLIFWRVKRGQKAFLLYIGLFAISLLIYLPWLCRNVILSGYLLYPVPFIDIFSFDWKAPKDVLLLDYIYIKRLPINFDDGLVHIQPAPFPHWVWPWMQKQFNNGMRSELFIFLMAICSPLIWLTAKLKNIKQSGPAVCFWLLIYYCVFIWFVNVPEYRFGIVFISFAIVLPVVTITMHKPKKRAPVIAIIVVLFAAQSIYYVYTAAGIKNIQAFSFGHFLIYPLRDKQYYFNNNGAGFRYTLLNNGVRLYHQDSTHNCINAELPCAVYKYGTIEMRGTSLSDGFKNVQDDVRSNYPFVK
jgi:hypothetical protein